MTMPDPDPDNLADHATNYARQGLAIFPVNPRNKTPRISQYKATTNPDQVAAWWQHWPDALIGHRPAPQHVILDVDPRHGGLTTWKTILAQLDYRPVTRWHRSGRNDGGGHLWWQRPDDQLTATHLDTWAREHGTGHQVPGTNRWVSGIDILHHTHRYSILPPSPHPDTGQPYEWRIGLQQEPSVMPAILADLITNTTPPTPPPPPRPVDPTSPADWYSNNHTWADLLTRHGWTLRAGTGNDNGSRWRHPTATSAFSATIRHNCLFVYSPNTPFDPTAPGDPHGYTLFHAWAALEHQGDMAAAAREARELRDGPRSPQDAPHDWIGTHHTPPTPQGNTDPKTGEIATNNNTDTPRPSREIVLTPASAYKLRKVRWIWDERLALGTLGLLAGPEGLGKSTLAYWLAARITQGELPGEYHGQPRTVFICATEDSWSHTIVPRLMAAGANLDLCFNIEIKLHDDITVGLSLPADLKATEQAAIKHNTALLILDPLMSRLHESLDTHRDGDVRRALEPLVSIADNAGLAILGLIHHNKSGATDPLQLVMASKAFTAVARSVHTVIKDPDDETEHRRLFGTPKNNLGRTDLNVLGFTIEGWAFTDDEGDTGWTGRLIWGPDGTGTINDALIRANTDPEVKTATSEAADWLADYLDAYGPKVPSADAKAAGQKAGHNDTAIKRARRQLNLEVVNEGFPRITYWVAPQSGHTVGPVSRGDDLTDPTGPTVNTKAQVNASWASRASRVMSPREATRLDDPTDEPESVPECRFTAGSFRCTNDPCPNPNHQPDEVEF